MRYLSAAIQRGFGAQVEAPAPSEAAQQVAAQRAEAGAREAAEEAVRETARAERRRFRAVEAALARRNPTPRDAARRLFAERIANDLDPAGLARNGWASALNAMAIFAFSDKMEPGLFDAA